MYYDDAKIKELVLRQTFLIAKGYFDPKEYFQAIKIENLDDQTFDNKIRAMFNWSIISDFSILRCFIVKMFDYFNLYEVKLTPLQMKQ